MRVLTVLGTRPEIIKLAPVISALPWDHVTQRTGEGGVRPEGATDAHLHLMVQCMETWLVARRPVLLSAQVWPE